MWERRLPSGSESRRCKRAADRGRHAHAVLVLYCTAGATVTRPSPRGPAGGGGGAFGALANLNRPTHRPISDKIYLGKFLLRKNEIRKKKAFCPRPKDLFVAPKSMKHSAPQKGGQRQTKNAKSKSIIDSVNQVRKTESRRNAIAIIKHCFPFGCCPKKLTYIIFQKHLTQKLEFRKTVFSRFYFHGFKEARKSIWRLVVGPLTRFWPLSPPLCRPTPVSWAVGR